MKRRPHVGTRVLVVGGTHAGRQGRTTPSHGHAFNHVAVELLGGVMSVGVSIALKDVELDKESVRILKPVAVRQDDVLYSLRGDVVPLGRRIEVKRIPRDPEGRVRLYVEGDYVAIYGMSEILPTSGFEKRWCRRDGALLETFA